MRLPIFSLVASLSLSASALDFVDSQAMKDAAEEGVTNGEEIALPEPLADDDSGDIQSMIQDVAWRGSTTCFARGSSGRVFRGTAQHAQSARNRAMQTCARHSNRCRLSSCRRNW